MGVEGPGVGGVGYGTLSLGVDVNVGGAETQFGVEGAGLGTVGYGISSIGEATESMAAGGEYGLQQQTTITTTTTNMDVGLASTIQPGFLPSAYETTVQNPFKQASHINILYNFILFNLLEKINFNND